jgi:homoserine/homoserine lactone efflux protein
MNVHLLLAYTVLEFWLCLTPGPAVLTVAGQGARHGWRKAAWGAAGICAANLVYFAVSAAGLGAFLAASPAVFAVLRWGGIGYLAWSGLRLLRAEPGAGAPTREVEGRPRALFMQAVSTQLGNPKAIIFFTSILAPFIDAHAAWSIPAQLAVYAVVTEATEFPLLVLFAAAAARGGRLLPARRAGLWQDRIAGVSLVAVAGRLAGAALAPGVAGRVGEGLSAAHARRVTWRPKLGMSDPERGVNRCGN